MNLRSDLALVLRVVPYQDRHQILTALTQNHGRVTVMARNSVQSRRFGAALELLTAGEWQWTEREGQEMGTLSEATVRYPYEGLRRNLETFATAGVIAEIALRISYPNETCGPLFQLVSNALMGLEETQTEDTRAALLNVFLGKTLQWCGHQPLLTQCSACGNKLEDCRGEALILPDVASWMCEDCQRDHHAQGVTAPLLALQDLKIGLEFPTRKFLQIGHFQAGPHRQLTEALVLVLQYHVPGFDRAPIKSLQILRSTSPRLEVNLP